MAQSGNMVIPNFSGGINQYIDKSLLKMNQSPSASNCNTDDGTLRTHKGTAKYTSAVLPSSIKTLIPCFTGLGELLVASNGKLSKLSNDSYVDIYNALTNNNLDYINFEVAGTKVLIVGNGVDNTLIYDGTIIRKLLNRRPTYDDTGVLNGYVDANGVVHATTADITTYAPKCKFIELHYNRIWASGDIDNPNRVYFSSTGVNGQDPEDWTAPVEEAEANQHGGFEDMPTWDGGVVIGLKVVFNDLLVFKNKTIFKVFGTNPSNYTKVQLFNSNGAIADKSIATGSNRAFFLNTDGIYQYDGTNVNLVSQAIKDIVSRINPTYVDKACGIFYGNKYLLAVPLDTSTINNAVIEYNVDLNTYNLVEGVNINSFAEFNSKLLFVTESGKMCIYNFGTSFDGEQIAMYWETGTTDLGSKNSIKTTNDIYFIGSGDGSVKFTLTTNRKSTIVIVPLTAEEKMYKKRVNNYGRTIKLKIENVNGSNICIKSPEVLVELDID